ncbi:MAG: Na/Pi cotransporter family protein [Chlorobiaceae bacterium]
MEGTLSLSGIAVLFGGGLSLFLFGIRMMSSGLKKASGSQVRKWISKISANRFYAVLAGAFATVIVQSSSTIIAILVGLVQSRLMTSSQALAVMLGAEIGTTTMAQLVAFRLHDYALVFFAAGFLLTALAKSESLRFTGEAVSGFGLLFFGLKLMSGALIPLESYSPFLSLLRYLDNPLFGVLAGMFLTALMHSSGAFVGILVTLSLQGALRLEAGIALMLGANIGTCITGVLASAGMQRSAKRVALAQVLFNVAGVLFFLPIIPGFADLIRLLSPSASGSGIVKLSNDVPRQIANAHLLINLFMALCFFPFLSFFDRLLYWLFPDDPEETRLIPAVWYLNESALSTPVLALQYAKAEVARMGSIAGKMVRASLYPLESNVPGHDLVFPKLSVISGMSMREEKLDFLESAISDYLIKIRRSELNERDSKEVFVLMNIVNILESIGDMVESFASKLVEKRRVLKSDLSEKGKFELVEIHKVVCQEMDELAEALKDMDANRAVKLLDGDVRFKQLVAQAETAHLKRVFVMPEAEVTHDVHTELLDLLEQVHHYCKMIAGSMLVSGKSEQ